MQEINRVISNIDGQNYYCWGAMVKLLDIATILCRRLRIVEFSIMKLLCLFYHLTFFFTFVQKSIYE